ncbi:putative sterigmatocystin biosynthesis monooxygenase stcW [Fonsecaea pedrosoi]|nr:putative sterigmatocystin biosynthesis monooxygenase stcW [Fonsecaea pedrosoi]
MTPSNPSEDVYIPEQFFGTKRRLKVIVVGAGVSGLNFFKLAEEKGEELDIVCFEKNNDIGGTWLENRYPGCACDVPSVVYQYPWRPAPWSHYWSQASEIWDYLKTVERENHFVEKYVKLRHEVLFMSWTDEAGRWEVEVQDLESGSRWVESGDVVINATGVLNKWKWPNINGLQSFKGILLHSAAWDPNVDLTGKRVAVIGAGSSAVQIIPSIYDSVEKIYTWVRSKIWITGTFSQQFVRSDGANYAYSPEQQQIFSNEDEYLAYRKMVEEPFNRRFGFILNGTKEQKAALKFCHDYMTTNLQSRPDIRDKIVPTDFSVGCRRPTPGYGYLQSLCGPKTTTYTQELTTITENGFLDPDDNEHAVDVIICATGFDTTFKPRTPLLVNGVDMGKLWSTRETVPSYLSVGLAGVPNYFISGGAYFPVAHGSFFPLIHKFCEYTLQILEKMQLENITSVRPNLQRTDQFLSHADAFLKRTVWTDPCTSWFKGGKKDGKPALWPGSRLHFLKLLEAPRMEDYDIEYSVPENPFAFLGNGMHVAEIENGGDLTWYLGNPAHDVDKARIAQLMSANEKLTNGTLVA